MDTSVEKTSVRRAQSQDAETESRSCTLYEARGENMQSVSCSDLESLRKRAYRATPDCPLLTLLPEEITKIDTVGSTYGDVPFGCVVSYQLRPQPKAPLVIPAARDNIASTAGTALARNADRTPVAAQQQRRFGVPFLDLPLAREGCSDEDDHDFVAPIPLSKAVDVEVKTCSQRDSTLWQELRKKTLTASRFHRVIVRKQFSAEFAASLMAESNISSLPAVAHGIAKEMVARRQYLAAQADLGNEGYMVQDCGLVLHPRYQFLGASPDGQVFDPSVADMHGLLEIKCPASAYNNDFLLLPKLARIPRFSAFSWTTG